jgi:hypothetical protein
VPVVLCRKILWHVKSPAEYESDTSSAKFKGFFAKFLPASLQGVCFGICKTTLVDERGMIRTQMGKHCRSIIVAVYGTPCAIPPRKQQNNGTPRVVVTWDSFHSTQK